MKKRILIGVGTRPEAVKMAPIIMELKAQSDFEVFVCSTGQHKEMLAGVLDFFNIQTDIDFSLMDRSKNILDLSSQTMQQLDQYLDLIKPDIVLGQGDTTTAFMMALASYYKHIPFAHVEAGLRTGNMYSPWPEEGNRKMISAIANLHFAPTEESKNNLVSEGVDPRTIYVTGNTVIDALLHTSKKSIKQPQGLSFLDVKKNTVLITGHRRENLGVNFDNIFGSIKELTGMHKDLQFVYPMHPSPAVRRSIESVFDFKKLPKNLYLIEPLEYPDFVWLMNHSLIILTDSGGLQEEAPSLDKPVLVTRDTTERPEGVAAGTIKLVGIEKEVIVRSVNELITDEKLYQSMAQSKNPYGDGTSAKKIHKFLLKYYENTNDK